MQNTQPNFASKFRQRVTDYALRHLKEEVPRRLEQLGVPKSAIPNLPEEIQGWVESHSLMPQFKSRNQGSLLRDYGKAIGEAVIVPVIREILPLIDNSFELLELKRIELVLQRNKIEMMKTKLLKFRYKALLGQIKLSYNQQLWRGADVIVVKERIPLDHLPWSHEDDLQVVTGTEEMGRLVSSVFENVQGMMNPILFYLNKYEFFGRLGQAAINAIAQQLCDMQVALAIVDAAESFREEHMADFMEELDQKESMLKQVVK